MHHEREITAEDDSDKNILPTKKEKPKKRSAEQLPLWFFSCGVMFRVKLSERCDVSSHTNAAATRHPSNPGASHLRESLRADLADVGGDALPPSLAAVTHLLSDLLPGRSWWWVWQSSHWRDRSNKASLPSKKKKKKGWLDDCQGMEGGRLRLQNCCRQNSYVAFL